MTKHKLLKVNNTVGTITTHTGLRGMSTQRAGEEGRWSKSAYNITPLGGVGLEPADKTIYVIETQKKISHNFSFGWSGERNANILTSIKILSVLFQNWRLLH